MWGRRSALRGRVLGMDAVHLGDEGVVRIYGVQPRVRIDVGAVPRDELFAVAAVEDGDERVPGDVEESGCQASGQHHASPVDLLSERDTSGEGTPFVDDVGH